MGGMKYSIRDVFWLTAVVALAVGWGNEAYRSPSRELEFRAQAMEYMMEREGITIIEQTPFRVTIEKPGTFYIEYNRLGDEEPPVASSRP